VDHYDDDDDESPIKAIATGIVINVIVIAIGVVVLTIIAGLSLAAVAIEKTPQAYVEFITASLGVQGQISVHTEEKTWTIDTPRDSLKEVKSTVKPFYTTYWNGGQVLFYVPAEVWSAAVAANQKYSWCDPRFIVALAHSESSVYNNNVCSGAGACGTWQFMPGTWAGLWKGTNPVPERTDRFAAADAACRYTKSNGMIDALGNKQAFIKEFASDPPVWNAYPPQAEYVYDLYQQVIANGDTVPDPSHKGPAYGITKVWWKQPVVWLLKSFNFWPETLAYNPDSPENFPPAEGDDLLALPVGTVTWGLHGQNYGDCAIDLGGGNGAKVISPINGIVTQRFTDGLGNPTIRIENSIFIIDLLHGNWDVKVGQKLTIGDQVGTESNQGNTGYIDANGVFHFCGTGSSCGYHVHFDVARRGKTCVDPQTLINWPPKADKK
jgi:hypothetical protein